LTFTNYCSLLREYSINNPDFVFSAKHICDDVTGLYQMDFVAEGLVTLMRGVYLYLIVKAYGVVKSKFNEEEKRRRRKEKFDENMKNKNPYDVNRKV
jgi:hypothetical protein